MYYIIAINTDMIVYCLE